LPTNLQSQLAAERRQQPLYDPALENKADATSIRLFVARIAEQFDIAAGLFP
jgi:hypothetical protein